MTAAISTIREVPLQQLEQLCRALAQVLDQAGLTPAQVSEAFRLGLSAECVRCGMRLSGEDLFALSEPPSAEHGSIKLGRLRLGDCARQGCQSYVYRLTLWNFPTLDWRAVIPKAEAIQQGRGEETVSQAVSSTSVAAPSFLRGAALTRLACRIAAALVVVAVLLVVWQWRRGGRIPILREPEHFRVTVAPAGEE